MIGEYVMGGHVFLTYTDGWVIHLGDVSWVDIMGGYVMDIN